MKFHTVIWIILFITSQAVAQRVSFDDPNIIFKDSVGNVLSSEQAMDLFMKYRMKIAPDSAVGGKKVFVLKRIVPQTPPPAQQDDSKWTLKWKGASLPKFSLLDLKNNPVTNETLKGKVVVLNFWFIGCKPCVKEMPYLNKLVAKYAESGIIFLAPSFDSAPKLQDFFLVNEFDYTVLPSANAFAEAMEIQSYPTHVIVGRDGKIYDLFSGANSSVLEKIDGILKKVLEAK